jgi:hypothetical protein
MMKNIYGDQCISRKRYYEWFKLFKDGRQSIHDEPRLGRPSTSYDDAHVAHVREIVCINRRLTMREIGEKCSISIGSCHDILTTKLQINWVVSKLSHDF